MKHAALLIYLGVKSACSGSFVCLFVFSISTRTRTTVSSSWVSLISGPKISFHCRVSLAFSLGPAPIHSSLHTFHLSSTMLWPRVNSPSCGCVTAQILLTFRLVTRPLYSEDKDYITCVLIVIQRLPTNPIPMSPQGQTSSFAICWERSTK